MSDIKIKEMKKDLYNFIELHRMRLRLRNFQFSNESGAALDRGLSWFSYESKLEEARLFAETGSYSEYFNFCVNESFYSLQIGDESMLQFQLESNSSGVFSRGSLAFIPCPGNGFDYFRFDCDPDQARHFRHNRYHIHFGFHAKNMRVSAYQFPWPSEFLAFVAHLMSDGKGRAVINSDFHCNAKITGFHHEHLLRNLSACSESFNHIFKFNCIENGGTRHEELTGSDWREECDV